MINIPSTKTAKKEKVFKAQREKEIALEQMGYEFVCRDNKDVIWRFPGPKNIHAVKISTDGRVSRMVSN